MSARLLQLTSQSASRGRTRRAEDEPCTLPQRAWLNLRGPRLLWRAANQVGKSRGLAKKILHFIRRTGPYADRPRRPVKILVMSFSKEQMEPLHEKLWQLLPRDEIGPGVEFEPGFGFRGKPPRIRFTSGPGAGSLIVFATYKQGSRRAAGGTFDIVALDEPVEERIWGEVQPRVLHGNPGEVWVTFTPTPDSPPLDYLRELVKTGQVVELHTELSLRNVTLETGKPLLSQRQIDEYIGSLLAVEKDMRVRGGWDIVTTERALDNWGPHCVGIHAPPHGAYVAVGIDHGAGSGKQAAGVVVIDGAHGLHPRAWVLNEHVAEGFTTPEQDARAIVAMLSSVGLNYDDVDLWIGDRASGMNKFDIRKTNQDLRRYLAQVLGRDSRTLKWIETPRKWDGSVMYGFRLMNAMMGRRTDPQGQPDAGALPHFIVHPRCAKFAAAAAKWNWRPKDPAKDVLDCVRYPVERVVQPQQWFSFKANYA